MTTPVLIPLEAGPRRAVLTWPGPGEPVQSLPGSTLTDVELRAVLDHLGTAQRAELGDADGPPGLELPAPWLPISSASAMTVALGNLASVTGVAPTWDLVDGLDELEALEEAAHRALEVTP